MRNKAIEHFDRSVTRNPSYVLSLLGSAETSLSLGYARTEYNRDSRDQYLERPAAPRESHHPLPPDAGEPRCPGPRRVPASNGHP